MNETVPRFSPVGCPTWIIHLPPGKRLRWVATPVIGWVHRFTHTDEQEPVLQLLWVAPDGVQHDLPDWNDSDIAYDPEIAESIAEERNLE